jgi:hypothetical protein
MDRREIIEWIEDRKRAGATKRTIEREARKLGVTNKQTVFYLSAINKRWDEDAEKIGKGLGGTIEYLARLREKAEEWGKPSEALAITKEINRLLKVGEEDAETQEDPITRQIVEIVVKGKNED